MTKSYFQTGGINTYVSPFSNDGALIHSVNMVSFPYGAKTKRSGYSTFLGTVDGQQVQSLFSFPNIGNNAGSMNLFRASGSSIYYASQGTAAWALAGNGTISNGAHFGQAVLNNTLIGGDGVGSTRYTTNGTSFTNASLAPIAEFFEQYQNRIYAGGTASTLFYSTSNDATNWNTSGTSDSSSLQIPGAGKMGNILKTADRLISTKTSGLMYRWDGFSLTDMSTNYGPSSPYSIAKTEDYRFFINQYGHFGFAGDKPQLLSNAIQRQFYNDKNTGIAGTAFPTIPAEVHRYDCLASVGTITDDFTSRQISNAIIKYDYQKNEYLNWSFANKPTALHSYTDLNGIRQLIFGDSGGQVYQMDNSFTDNGVAIPSEMVYVYYFDSPEYAKAWKFWRGFFNPGCEAKVQIACANTYTYQTLKWEELGDCNDGICEFRFPAGSRSRLLFVRIYESSKNARYVYFGCNIQAEIQKVD